MNRVVVYVYDWATLHSNGMNDLISVVFERLACAVFLKTYNQVAVRSKIQVSAMTGIKDPTEKPKVHEVRNEMLEKNALLKKSFADFKVNYVETCLEFSKDMMESLRLLVEELKVRFEQFREQPQSILDFFSLSNLLNWTKGEQINETMNEKLPKH